MVSFWKKRFEDSEKILKLVISPTRIGLRDFIWKLEGGYLVFGIGRNLTITSKKAAKFDI